MADEIPRSRLRRLAREQAAHRVQAETLIWRIVRHRTCNGARFQRQVPLQTYIADFIAS
jgi:very-short-patch-repair endonuclease